ncbi:hypothetical protein GIY30_20155 [Gordonia sp. HNM0687]|uniref:Chaplin domain-containing protein n=1 Tax=Gordonia mangrovi TaxID=2665643 RepID=A0A6L7GUN5_9ACTN|nr:hypothetical protein [Gordonia mangrovi]MXP23656.1 hypothetical protein [Gordonia mangrovi]UVF79718.1 hypothetical protein NWF22_07775 [Gordonia mangrovi]
MKRKMTAVAGTAAAVFGIGLLAVPTAAAATPEPHQAANVFGSVSICVNIPIGPATVSICL